MIAMAICHFRDRSARRAEQLHGARRNSQSGYGNELALALPAEAGPLAMAPQRQGQIGISCLGQRSCGSHWRLFIQFPVPERPVEQEQQAQPPQPHHCNRSLNFELAGWPQAPASNQQRATGWQQHRAELRQ